MKRRILAFVCMLSILMGMFVIPVTAASGDSNGADSYQVGYAKVDLNPFIKTEATKAVFGDVGIEPRDDYDDAATYVRQIKVQRYVGDTEGVLVDFVGPTMSGYGGVTTRYANNMTDDNGDGMVGAGDGLFGTATAVTDQWGNTVIYITYDFLNGYDVFTSTVRDAVFKQLANKTTINRNNIMISGNHSHEAPIISTLYSSWVKNDKKGTPSALGTYWLYIIDQLTNAAVTAYENSVESVMTKGTIDAPTAMKEMGYTYDNGEGFKLNFVRHYKVTQTTESVTMKRKSIISSWTESSSTVTDTKVFYIGDNFGSASAGVKTTTGSASLGATTRTDTRVTTVLEHATKGDQSMNILMFTPVDETAGNKPVVMIDWRAHASNNGHSYLSNLSSDYTNALRYRLENNKTLFGGNSDYNVAFWQGLSGNVNGNSRISDEYAFNSVADLSLNKGYMSISLDDNKDDVEDVQVVNTAGDNAFYQAYYASTGDDAYDPNTSIILSGTSTSTKYKSEFYRAAKYGYILAKVALFIMETDGDNDGLLDHMSQNLNHGIIRCAQKTYSAARRTWDEGYFEAAYQAIKVENKKTGYPYDYTYGDKIITLNSFYHANAILDDHSYTVAEDGTITKTLITTPIAVELNAILMGENVALVFGTGEFFDHYDSDEDPNVNRWNKLAKVPGAAYGTPFKLSYSNHATGYAPNNRAYEFVTNAAGTAIGSYDANTTNYAQGTGEQIVDELASMLDGLLNGRKTYHCPHCDADADWLPLDASASGTKYLGTGHYYLTEDLPMSTSVQKTLGVDGMDIKETLSLDLNGYPLSSASRCYILYKGSILNVFNMINNVAGKNSGSTGKMIGHTSTNNPGGGSFSLNSGTTLNLYSGTLTFQQLYDVGYGVGYGGVASIGGTMNIYGGVVQGGDMVNSTYSTTETYNGCGGAVTVNSKGALNVYGGEIKSGTVPEGGFGPCVYLASTTSKINLYGDAVVEDIFYRYNDTSMLNAYGTYTGTANLSFHEGITLSSGMQIGKMDALDDEEGDISEAAFTVTDKPTWGVMEEDGKLLLYGYADDTVAIIGGTEYNDLQNALNAFDSSIITMIQSVEEDISVETKDVYLDLNGCSITGTVSTAGGYTLYCKDSMTDDFTVADNKYGKIANIAENSNVQGIPEESDLADDGYLKITEEDGISFHCVDLKLSHVTLKPVHKGECTPSIYYKCNFKGDEKVAAAVDYYGVALSVQKMPDVSNIESSSCKYSKILVTDSPFEAGEVGNSGNGTLLKGIMKAENTSLANTRYSNMAIYGKAYIHTADGYMMGAGAQRTLKQVTQEVDTSWISLTDEQKDSMKTMYNTFASVMERWYLPNLVEALG